MNRMIMIAALATLMLTGCGKPAQAPAVPVPTKAPEAAVPPAPSTTSADKAATGAPAPVASAAIATLDDKQALEIMNKAGCVACHDIDKKIMGPAYIDVAKKRKGEPGAAAMLEEKIREGGGGAYGPIPMPPNPKSKISDDELNAMVKWVLTK